MIEKIEKSNRLELHYFFNDESHTINSLLRNECEKEILYLIKEISETLRLKIDIETLPPEEGGFKESWKFLGKNANQITIIVSVAAIVISRIPIENHELTKLQIENLILDNEIKKKELEKLNLEFLDENAINKNTIKDSVEFVNKNYRIAWRKSNFYKKLNNYPKINSIEVQRLEENIPVGKPRKTLKNEFSKYILLNDNLPDSEFEKAIIDVISPTLKRGNFKWKGFYENVIINFKMNDISFREKVLNGEIHFSNKFSIEVKMSQERKINQDGNIVVTNTFVHKVFASFEGEDRIDY
jgi:hypothetical protein